MVQKGECRPNADANYMSLKRRSIKLASQPTRQVLQLDKAVVNYKPVAMHKNDAEFEQKRKAEGKKARDDKDKVSGVLFAAFEKHQYYQLKDLVKITNQPIVSPLASCPVLTCPLLSCPVLSCPGHEHVQPYVKEILNEFCVYNSKNPHKNTWELKPEYRHYNKSEAV